MKEKKRLEIVWESHAITTIRLGPDRFTTAFCTSCRSESPHLNVAQAGTFMQITTREVIRKIESGEVHYSETKGGNLLVCRNSCRNRLG